MKKFLYIVFPLTIVLIFLSPQVFNQENNLIKLRKNFDDINLLKESFPSAKLEELKNFNKNLETALQNIEPKHSKENSSEVISDIYKPKNTNLSKVIPVSEHINLKLTSKSEIEYDEIKKYRPYSLIRTSSYKLYDASSSEANVIYTLTCTYQYNHATDIICSDVVATGKSTIAGLNYTLDISDESTGKTGSGAWGKAKYKTNIYYKNLFTKIILKSSINVGKIRVTPTTKDNKHYYFVISNEWY